MITLSIIFEILFIISCYSWYANGYDLLRVLIIFGYIFLAGVVLNWIALIVLCLHYLP